MAGTYSDGNSCCFGGLILDNCPLYVITSFDRQLAAEIVDNGFWVRYYINASNYIRVYTNRDGRLFHYAALR